MIGRFSNLGVYRELLRSADFYRIVLAGALALISYLTPIMGAIVHNIGSVLVVVSSATMAMVKER